MSNYVINVKGKDGSLMFEIVDDNSTVYERPILFNESSLPVIKVNHAILESLRYPNEVINFIDFDTNKRYTILSVFSIYEEDVTVAVYCIDDESLSIEHNIVKCDGEYKCPYMKHFVTDTLERI